MLNKLLDRLFVKYDPPVEGDIIVFTKSFWYDGSISSYKKQGHGAKPNVQRILKGDEGFVSLVMDIKQPKITMIGGLISVQPITGKEEVKRLIWVTLESGEYKGLQIRLELKKSRKYWATKADIRDNKINKLLKNR